MTAVRYEDEDLEPYVCHFTNANDPDFVLMHGNTRGIELNCLANLRKVGIFAEWIGQLDLQTSSLQTMAGMLWGRHL
ncbi:hypothetical protein TNCV_4119281 [Trichonephila clavipes]|nr:hypothetical protein TNCV_4119281 [Trichonephila clavipes]